MFRYDAVTVEGRLQWQDGLTELNRPYFDECDGIFINYTWKPNTLSLSVENLGEGVVYEFWSVFFLIRFSTFCRTDNRGRAGDIYYGIDVFGRGTYGGGGYNCDKAIQELSLPQLTFPETSGTDCSMFSVAVFAPGWVLETQVDAHFSASSGSDSDMSPSSNK